MANTIREIRKSNSQSDKKKIGSFKMPLKNVRSNLKLEQGLFDAGNRWEFDLTDEMLRAFGIETDKDITIQLFKIAGANIVNVDVLSN